MNTTIHVNRNEGGIINTGNNGNIFVQNIKDEYQKINDIKWETLSQEIMALKSSPDSSIKSLLKKLIKQQKKRTNKDCLIYCQNGFHV